jgi:cell division protein FtsX
VSVRSDLGLGVRLAVAGGRQALARLLLIGSGIALGVGLLLSTLGIFPAEAAVDRRAAARQFDYLDPEVSPPADHLVVGFAETTFGDERIQVYFVASVGEPAPPPFLPRLPRPEELVVSPALANLLASPEERLLMERFPGEVTATLDERWVIHPGELVAYVGARKSDLPPYAEVAASGRSASPQHRGSGGGIAIERPLVQVSFLVSIGLLLPILVFIVTGARLSASSRETRLAAIRLVGGTPSQVRLVAAGESLLAALSGCVLGVGLFLVGRPFLAGVVPPGDRWFPSDIAPTAPVFVSVLVGVAMLSVGVTLVSMRRVVVTPLGVVRRRARPVRSSWRWAMLAAGLGGLFTVLLLGRTLIANDPVALPFVVVSYALTGLGAAAAAPVAGSAIASALARIVPRRALLLGARRLRADPRASGRTVAAVVIVVVAATITSLYVGVYEADYADATFPASLRPTTVIVESYEGIDADDVREATETIEGVHDATPVWLGYTNQGFAVMIADCDGLDAVVLEDVPTCRPGDALIGGSLFGGSLRPTLRVGLETGGSTRVQVDPGHATRLALELGRWRYSVLVPIEAASAALVRERPAAVFLATDGDPATVERIRNALFPSIGLRIHPRGDPIDYVDEVPTLVGAAVTLGLLITFTIAAGTMLVATVDAIGERRRSLATLTALGTPAWTLRGALAVETALPMLAGVALGIGSSVAGTWMLFQAIANSEEMRNAPPIQWRSLGVVVAFAISATVVATIATFPSLGRAIRPESLRTE